MWDVRGATGIARALEQKLSKESGCGHRNLEVSSIICEVGWGKPGDRYDVHPILPEASLETWRRPNLLQKATPVRVEKVSFVNGLGGFEARCEI